MPSVNLAPGTQLAIAAGKRRRRLFLLSTLVILLVVAAWAGMFFYQNSLDAQLEETRGQIRTVESEIARLADEADRVQAFENRLTAIGGLLDRHIDWDPVLQDIESLLPNTVVLTGITVQAKTGQMIVEGVTGDIDQVALSLASFLAEQSDSVFTSGELTSVVRKTVGNEEEGLRTEYDFQIQLAFNPTVLAGE